MRKQPCVYILTSRQLGTIFIGVTADPIARVFQHRSETGDGFTSRYDVHRLVRYEFFASMPEAIARAKQLKRSHRAWKINLIERENGDWADLAVTLGLELSADRARRDGC